MNPVMSSSTKKRKMNAGRNHPKSLVADTRRNNDIPHPSIAITPSLTPTSKLTLFRLINSWILIDSRIMPVTISPIANNWVMLSISLKNITPKTAVISPQAAPMGLTSDTCAVSNPL